MGLLQNLHLVSARQIANALKAQELTSVDVVKYFIERIQTLDTSINSVVCWDFERALITAERADAQLADADGMHVGPLHGVPITVTESLDVQGLPTTYGLSKSDPVAMDCPAVANIKAAGAIILGKTNTAAGNTDWQSYNGIYGTTNNPWDVTRTCGGSSGGSAAAVVSGLSPLGVGMGVGGSIQIPAHFCGVFGHKPTYGVIPTTQPTPDMTSIGPLANSADDLMFLLETLADKTPTRQPLLALPEKSLSLADFRVAVWLDEPGYNKQFSVDEKTREALESITRVLRDEGVSVDTSARPVDGAVCHEHYLQLLSAVYAGEMTDTQYEEGSRELARAFASDCGGLSGTYDPNYIEAIRRHQLSYRTWHNTNKARWQLKSQWESFFEKFDIIIAPVSRTQAFEHDHTAALRPMYIPSKRNMMIDAKPTQYADNVFWSGLADLALLPSTTFPTPSDKFPMGLQAIGASHKDLFTIEFSKLVTEKLFLSNSTPRPSI